MARPPFQVDEFVGQQKNIAPILRQQDGALARGEPLSHCLFTGPSGLGKSLLARVLARRGKTNLIKFLGDAAVDQVVEGLAGMQAADVAFFDEAHSLSNETQELLFDVIDGGEAPGRHVPAAKGKEPLKLAAVTLIFATDRPGKLLNALVKRIPIRVHFGPYPERELKEIVSRVADRRGVLLSPQAARRLARVCNGMPRRAEHSVNQLRHHFSDAEQRQLTVSDVRKFLQAWGIDRQGLGKQERSYLEFLRRNGSGSLETLASYLGFDASHVKSQIEQPLRYRGLIRIQSSGRVLTSDGKALVQRWRSARRRKRKD